jgi:tRNA A37 threonylcarbamoyladenosine dehydratase
MPTVHTPRLLQSLIQAPSTITVEVQLQEATRTTNRLDQNRTSPQHIIIKTTSKENRRRISKAVREKKQVMYKGKPIKITADFSTETLKAKREKSEVF